MIHKLTIEDIRDFFGPTIFQRGQSYYRNGMISQFKIVGRKITALSQGSYISHYRIRIKLTEQGFKGRCTCPYEGYCKHMAAVLLTYINQHQRDQTASEGHGEEGKWIQQFQGLDRNKISTEKINQVFSYLEAYSNQFPAFGLLTALSLDIGKQSIKHLVTVYEGRIQEIFDTIKFDIDLSATGADQRYQESRDTEDDYYEDEDEYYDDDDYYENGDYYEDYFEDSITDFFEQEPAILQELETIVLEVCLLPSNLQYTLGKKLASYFFAAYNEREWRDLFLNKLPLFNQIMAILSKSANIQLQEEAERSTFIQFLSSELNRQFLADEVKSVLLKTLVDFATSAQDIQVVHSEFQKLQQRHVSDKKIIQNSIAELLRKTGDKKGYIRLKEQSLQFEKDYLELAEFLLKQQDVDGFER
ncbi:MAG: SWIM zinc finger domain-containing protein, partial [Candidatus Hodarchaeota archaeon]